MFSPQIHITFNSQEDKRITKPIIDNPPNKLYYFTAYIKKTQQKDVNLDFYKKNVKLLKEKIPSLEIIQKQADYTNYIEIIQEISKIIKFERDINNNCNIFINVSSGSKMTSIASIEASKLWECDIYYLYSSMYDPHGEGPRHSGKFHIIRPITFPINKPDERYVELLKLITQLIKRRYKNKDYNEKTKRFVYMKNLIIELELNGLIELDRENENPSYRKSALYMKARNILNPLIKDLKYVELTDDKRNKKVFLTDRGKDILDIFKFLV